jgi:hypothetical protein
MLPLVRVHLAWSGSPCDVVQGAGLRVRSPRVAAVHPIEVVSRLPAALVPKVWPHGRYRQRRSTDSSPHALRVSLPVSLDISHNVGGRH